MITTKMLGKVVKTSKLDLETAKSKEAEMSASHLVSSRPFPRGGLGSGRLNADLHATKASERSLKRPGINAPNYHGSPTALQAVVGPNKQQVSSQKQYASVQSMLGPQSLAKKTTIQTKGMGKGSMLNSSNISSSNLDLKQRQKMQSKNAGIHHTLLKKDQPHPATSKAKGTAVELRQMYSSTVCVPGSGGQKALISSGLDQHHAPVMKGMQKKTQGSNRRVGGNHSERSEPESRRAFSTQQATQPLSLEKKKQELK